ncbi:hypothetical protein [Primorskyibacter sp. 2E233]|uniref:Tc toxin subunit A-related protein n=1 Tax=Primorskyibacter sp. 2E233 TaxID=3413431 RepID=UPI003BF1E1AD
MALQKYEMVLATPWAKLREIDAILGDIAAIDTEKTARRVAEIELRIAEGDALARKRSYDKALAKYKTARALIYKILYPGFSISGYLAQTATVLLPTGQALERSLIEASISAADVARPMAPPPASALGIKVPPVDKPLRPFFNDGYREAVEGEEAIRQVSEQALRLIAEDKADAAVVVLEGAANTLENAEPTFAAALSLNLAAAQVQAGNPRAAARTSERAIQFFARAKDLVGQAQAMHIQGVAFSEMGNVDQAKELLAKAAELLAKAGGTGRELRPETSARLLPSVRPERATAIVRPEKTVTVDRDLRLLAPIAAQDNKALSFRIPGRDEAWTSLPLASKADRARHDKSWSVGVPVAGQIAEFTFSDTKKPGADEVIGRIYEQRIVAQAVSDLQLVWTGITSTTFYLKQLFSYALLLKIGDMYHHTGQYRQAERHYLQAAGYSHLNQTIEAAILWNRIARNAVRWGHALYKNEDLQAARVQYEKLIQTNGTEPPQSLLYDTASLGNPANEARQLIAGLMQRPLPSVNWEIAINVLTAFQYLQQISDGLDFYGLALSPIHTFEYLQSVARGFADEAIQAEREFVTFKMREEAEAATRRDLETTQAMAQAEVEIRFESWQAAIQEEQAAQHALDLAIERRNNAIDQRNAYAASSATQIWSQAAATALGAGEDAYYGEISELADKLARGETISGAAGKLAAAQVLLGGRRTREYELAKMQDNIDELTAAIPMATDQRDAAARRTAAAELAWQASQQRAGMATAALDAFDDEFFVPDTWSKMADVMRDISRAYLTRAIRIAKLMERAYNFENDTTYSIIKNEYGHGLANALPGEDARLLGGDSLAKDIDAFTYYAITRKTRKSSNIKDVVSISADYPAQFQQFLETGLLSLETELYEFDRRHPGFYAQRIEAIEVVFVGALPDGGVNGTLQLGGVTSYRKRNNTSATRIHQIDTMALSEYLLRNDGFVYRAETGVRGLFQGFGVATTWQLHLPRRSNAFDLRRIFDIQLDIYYTATFDAPLRTAILQAPPRADELARLTTFSLRHTFPDGWYAFYQGAAADFTVSPYQFPANQRNFAINGCFFRVETATGVSPEAIDLRIIGPGGVDAAVTTDADGVVSTDLGPLAGLIGQDPLGAWHVEVTGGASVTDGGAVVPTRIYNIRMGLDYSFEYLPEVAV